MTDEEVAETLDAIAETYRPRDPADPSIALVDGFGVRVRVESGHLEVSDGIGPHRRTRRYSRAERSLRRLVIVGDGVMTTQALRWCQAIGVSVVLVDDDGIVFAESPATSDDVRVRRAQAAAGMPGSPVGIEIVSRLLDAKLAGQVTNLRGLLGRADHAETVDELRAGLGGVASIDEARQIEASAAALYFDAWVDNPACAPRFATADLRRVPAHWTRYAGRRSLLVPSGNRKAGDPVNALCNYLFRLAEIECAFAARALGLDPGLGVLHLDAVNRASLALDLIEPVRPAVEAYVLQLLASRTFAKRDFTETTDGHVRVLAPLSHELATTMPRWAQLVAPVAESVTHVLGQAIAGKFTPRTPLTGAHSRAAAAQVKARKALNKPTRPNRVRADVAASWSCPDCGGPVTNPRRVRCDVCIAADPAQSPTIRKNRGRAISARRAATAEWDRNHPGAGYDPAMFARDILPNLAGVSLREITEATGLSKGYASTIRAGKWTPHVSTWATLAALAGVDVFTHAPVTPEEQTGAQERSTMPETTTTQPSPADLRQRAAIARGRERRRAELLPLRTEVAEAIEAVGWRRARPVVESVLGTVPVTGPHGAWWGKVGKRAGAAILAGLAALPAQPRQGALPLEQAQ